MGCAVIDLDAITEEWLNACGRCDADRPTFCTCNHDDPRTVIANLVDEVRRLQAALADAATALRDQTRDEAGPS